MSWADALALGQTSDVESPKASDLNWARRHIPWSAMLALSDNIPRPDPDWTRFTQWSPDHPWTHPWPRSMSKLRETTAVAFLRDMLLADDPGLRRKRFEIWSRIAGLPEAIPHDAQIFCEDVPARRRSGDSDARRRLDMHIRWKRGFGSVSHLVVEAKIDAGIGPGQLQDYVRDTREAFGADEHIFYLLLASCIGKSDIEKTNSSGARWKPLSWFALLREIERHRDDWRPDAEESMMLAWLWREAA